VLLLCLFLPSLCVLISLLLLLPSGQPANLLARMSKVRSSVALRVLLVHGLSLSLSLSLSLAVTLLLLLLVHCDSLVESRARRQISRENGRLVRNSKIERLLFKGFDLIGPPLDDLPSPCG